MLTIRKVRVASGDTAEARRRAGYVLAGSDSPAAFAFDATSPEAPSTMWLGSARMLERLGVRAGAPVTREQLVLALQGRHAITGDRVRREGWILRDAVDERGRPLADGRGRRRWVRTLGTKTVDLTFSAPKSVSVVWSQATADLRAMIEPAMLVAAAAMLRCMTQTKPVVAHQRRLEPAVGFAAAAALHVTARTARAETGPWPQLHVHGLVVGVERSDGYFASPELLGMFRDGAPVEGGAVARARLAEFLVDMGFEIESQTGGGARFFEIRDVPPTLVDRMSGRTRDVEAGIAEREAQKGARLTNGERAVVALQTRAPKSKDPGSRETRASWRAHGADVDFGPAEVEALRRGAGFVGTVEERSAPVRAAAVRRLRRAGPRVSVGAARAAVLECAAGRLRLEEALVLADEISLGPSPDLPQRPRPC
jgi:conjugative relaxase-like TrwC/TraI family protein